MHHALINATYYDSHKKIFSIKVFEQLRSHLTNTDHNHQSLVSTLATTLLLPEMCLTCTIICGTKTLGAICTLEQQHIGTLSENLLDCGLSKSLS